MREDEYRPSLFLIFRDLPVDAKVFDQFGNANSNEYQGPILPNEVKDIKAGKIVKQKQNPDSDQNKRTRYRARLDLSSSHLLLLFECQRL
jgi:hypothetical protein